MGSLDCDRGVSSPLRTGEETPFMGRGPLTTVAPGLILFHYTTSVQVAMFLIGLVIMTTAGWRLIMVINQ